MDLTPEEREILRLWGVIAALTARVPAHRILNYTDPNWREEARALAYRRYIENFFEESR